MELDTQYPLVDTQAIYAALNEYKERNLPPEVARFLKFKLWQAAKDLADVAAFIKKDIKKTDEFLKREEGDPNG
jgi:hypothetical protein